MARSLAQLILLTFFASVASQSLAEPEAPPERKPRKRGDETPTPEFENVRKALDALTPEQRKRFQDNFWRWSNLPPGEKKALRDREEVRKKFMEQEVEAALQASGLQLEGDRRAQFVQRYGEERRKIEEQLRKESMEKRKPMVKEMVARLKEEFSGTVAAPAEPTPVIAPAGSAEP